MEYPLKLLKPTVNPSWFYYIGYEDFEATVEADGSVLIRGERMIFSDPDQVLAVGTHFVCAQKYGGQFFGITPGESARRKQARRDELAARELAKETARATRMLAHAQATQDQADRLHFPVAWETAIKDVLSGLSPNSNGCGVNRRTVYHLRLLEPLSVGRLTRQEGDFLCTSAKGTNGQNWANFDGYTTLGTDGLVHPSPITCEGCLQRLQRFLLPTPA